jgi:DNA-binding XRE family transcriptional regulator
MTRPLTLRQSRLVDGGNGNQNSIVWIMKKLIDIEWSLAVGTRLKKLRLKSGLTQTELGEKIGISFQQIQKYENGLNTPSVPAIRMFASALGVDHCQICGCCDE